MIQNIVFDCSDTLLRFSALIELTNVLEDAERAADIKARIHGSPTWMRYDRGLVSEEGLRAEILPLFDDNDRPYAAWYLDNWLKCYSPIPGMLEIVTELKEKGWPLYIVSDFPPCFEELTVRFPEIFSAFDGMIVSYECQAIKGDKGLFAQFLQKFSLDPETCVFIDDVPRLVDNAKSLGFSGIIAGNAPRVRKQLVEMNIL